MKIFNQVRTVLWAFLGIRSKNGREKDGEEIKNPLIFLGIAIFLFFLFVFGLIIVVNIIV